MTNGLRRIGHFEAVLAAANRDEAHIDGIINPYLANAASRIINSPDFQRVKDRMVDDLQEKEIKHLETKRFEHNVTNLAVDARVNRADLDYIITNLQQPPPPPPPPPPSQPRDDAANRASIIAELDGIAIQRDKDMRAQMIAGLESCMLRFVLVLTRPSFDSRWRRLVLTRVGLESCRLRLVHA